MQSSEKASHDLWQHRDQPIIIIRGALLRVSPNLDPNDCHALSTVKFTTAFVMCG